MKSLREVSVDKGNRGLIGQICGQINGTKFLANGKVINFTCLIGIKELNDKSNNR